MSLPPVIEVQSLSKWYKTDFWKPKFCALDDVDFTVTEGMTFGLVGPNGAGKTTAIKCILGLVRPDGGEVAMFGQSVQTPAVKHRVGYLPEQAYYYDYLKAWEILDFYGRLFGLPTKLRRERTAALLDLVGLSDSRDRLLRHFSKGMLQRIGIAQALINEPDVVILDEPMSGLDPVGRKEVRDIILDLRRKGKTLVFSSHILHDVEMICDHVTILVKGRVTACGAIGELLNPRIKSTEITFHKSKQFAQPPDFKNKVEWRQAGVNVIAVTCQTSIVAEIIAWGQSMDMPLISIVPHKESLEDLFVEQMERSDVA